MHTCGNDTAGLSLFTSNTLCGPVHCSSTQLMVCNYGFVTEICSSSVNFCMLTDSNQAVMVLGMVAGACCCSGVWINRDPRYRTVSYCYINQSNTGYVTHYILQLKWQCMLTHLDSRYQPHNRSLFLELLLEPSSTAFRLLYFAWPWCPKPQI